MAQKKKHGKSKKHEKSQLSDKPKLTTKEYEAEISKLHVELVKVQEWVKHKGLRVIVLFEGRDAAGKGGTIKRITERVSPRVFRVVALPAPTEREKTQLYLQRYISQFPAGGEVVLFDRSWYNRAGVERVMGFCTDEEYERFMRNCPEFEHFIIEAGIILIKYWFDVSMEVQEQRFLARMEDPRKHWKLSPMDMESHRRWYDYSKARDAMLEVTDTEFAPWYIVRSDNKKRARLNCISHLVSTIPYKELPFKAPKLPKRDVKLKYDDQATIANRKFVPEKY